MGWQQILAIVAAGLLVWYMIYVVRRTPKLFSAENFSKSFLTMGILALGLIAFIGFCILLLRSSA